MQVANLENLARLNLADMSTRVVETGRVSDVHSYVLLQPVGRHLGREESPETIIQV